MEKLLIRIAVLVSLLMLPACAVMPMPGSPVLTVFAAASLTEPFSQIGAQFEDQHPGVTVTFNFAGSQQLAQQLLSGAPADVFASANQRQMDVAIEGGVAAADAVRRFTSNRLVVIVPADNPAGIASLQGLSRPGIKLVLAAAEVPVGQYSLEFLDKASQANGYELGYRDAVLANVVSYENDVKAVLTKVVLGEADAGIVYTSDAASADSGKVIQIDIPDALNVVAVYPLAVVAGSQQADLAQAFVDMVLSDDGQAILAEYGFLPVQE